MTGTDEVHVLDPEAQLEVLKAAVGRYPEPRRRPMSADELENEARLEGIAEDRQAERRYHSGPDADRMADRRADAEHQQRQDTNDRFADWDARRLGGRS